VCILQEDDVITPYYHGSPYREASHEIVSVANKSKYLPGIERDGKKGFCGL
jgi:hypothetical protein